MLNRTVLRFVGNSLSITGLAMSLASCAGGSGSDSALSHLYSGEIAVIEEHPFDLEKEIVTGSIVEAEDILALMAAREADTVGTDYDKMNSVVALLDGPFEKGDLVTMRYRQYVGGKWYNYTRPITIRHDPLGGAVLIINSYRITRNASVYLKIEVEDEVIAEHSFKVSGPNHRFGPPYSIESGGKTLNADEVLATLSGNSFRRDENGILTFSEDGTYIRVSETSRSRARWDVEADGKVCLSFNDGTRSCVVFYRDKDGNLKYSNDRARKWRLRKEI